MDVANYGMQQTDVTISSNKTQKNDFLDFFKYDIADNSMKNRSFALIFIKIRAKFKSLCAENQ